MTYGLFVESLLRLCGLRK